MYMVDMLSSDSHSKYAILNLMKKSSDLPITPISNTVKEVLSNIYSDRNI